MKHLILLTALIAAVSFEACKDNHSIKEKKAIAKNDSTLIIGNPFDYGVDNILIFPIGSNYRPDVYEYNNSDDNEITQALNKTATMYFASNSGVLNDRLADTEYINSDENEFDIRNILFYDLKSGKSYPLVTDTIHILSFALHKDFSNPMIIYRVVKEDYNKDTIFNSLDPVILFVSDLYGRNLTQITPDNEKFIDYFFYPETNIILLKTVIDGNKDKIFATSDETDFREMKIDEPSMGKEIFSKSLKDSLRF